MTGVQLRTAFPERQGRTLLNLMSKCFIDLSLNCVHVSAHYCCTLAYLTVCEVIKKVKKERKKTLKKKFPFFCTFCTFYIVPFPRKKSTASTIDLIMILLIAWLVITEECHTSLFLNSFDHVICKLPAILHYILSLVQVLSSKFLKETLN